MKFKLIVCLLCLLSIKKVSAQLQDKRTIIAGKVLNTKDSIIYLKGIHPHLGFLDGIQQECILDKNGEFKFIFQNKNTCIFRLYTQKYNESLIDDLSTFSQMMKGCANFYSECVDLLITPSDSIFIEIDDNAFKDYNNIHIESKINEFITITGSHAESKYYFIKNRCDFLKPIKEIFSINNAEQGLAAFDNEEKRMLSELELVKKSLDFEMIEFRQLYIKFFIKNQKVNYISVLLDDKKISNEKANIFFHSIFNESDPCNNKALNLDEYWLYIKRFIEFFTDNSDFIKKIEFKPTVLKYTFAQRNLTGKSKYYYQTGLLLSALSEINPTVYEVIYQDYIYQYPKEECTDLVIKTYKSAAKLTKGSPAPAFELKDKTGREIRLPELTGKYVYLAFTQFDDQTAKEMITYYEEIIRPVNDSNLVFIFVNLNPVKSITFNQEVKNLKGLYFQNQDVVKTGLHPYLQEKTGEAFLIDKTGKIAEDFAPWYGDDRFKVKIEQICSGNSK